MSLLLSTHKIWIPLIFQVASHFCPPIYQAFIEDLLCARKGTALWKRKHNACSQRSHGLRGEPSWCRITYITNWWRGDEGEMEDSEEARREEWLFCLRAWESSPEKVSEPYLENIPDAVPVTTPFYTWPDWASGVRQWISLASNQVRNLNSFPILHSQYPMQPRNWQGKQLDGGDEPKLH